MKALHFIALAAFVAYFVEGISTGEPPKLLGAKQCTWGPSYWCTNLTAASQCHAVRHCIQTVWEHKQLPPDTDNVCQTCIKMVTEARDQLESNETQEEIKEVFEGSCKLIPIKLVSKECCKIADDFIPELVDTLASEMNPQVVCSVAGLCNSEKIDKLIVEHGKSEEAPDSCEGCHTVIGIMQARFEKMSKDDVLQSLLQVCGRMSSLSDACSNIVVTYFKEIYDHLQTNFNANDVCLLSGECAAQFHTHVEITPLSKVGFVHVAAENDDLPCDLCKQLVKHLRDVLVANTTEVEFKRMLEGICNETKEFKDECKSLADEYFDVIYNYLSTNLNDTIICSAAGLCPSSDADKLAVPIAPILPVEQVTKILEISSDSKPLNRVGIGNDGSSAIQIMQKPEDMQLPIERVFPPHVQQTYNDQVCLFCEYFLHYLQQAITDPKTENEIKDIVDKGCDKLPSSVHDTCIAFVNDYGDAVVALLAQEIDPSTVCPLIKLCPSSDATNVEVFFEQKSNDSNCPLCLFAVTTLEGMITSAKTEAEIKVALDSLCAHFSAHVSQECQSFVNKYSDRLIEMLMADLTAQEVCVYLRLCQDEMPPKPLSPPSEPEDLQILTNEITDYTSNGEFIVPIQKVNKGNNKPQCVICEFAMQKLENILENKTTEAEIKQAVLKICVYLPKTVRSECTSFVNQYADMVINLLIASVKPDEICEYIGLCDKKAFDNRQPKIIDLDGIVDPVGILESSVEIVPPKKVKSPQCALCKIVMRQLERVLIGKMTKDEIVTALYKICDDIPTKYEDSCEKFMKDHADTIANLILDAVLPEEVCSILFLCSADFQNMKGEVLQCALCEAVYLNYVDLANRKQRITTAAICKSMTPEYKQPCRDMLKKEFSNLGIYQSLGVDMASACSELNYCKGSVPLRQRRQTGQVLVGGKPCTWGPSYWCASLENAQTCGQGALQHCRERQWKADAPSQ